MQTCANLLTTTMKHHMELAEMATLAVSEIIHSLTHWLTYYFSLHSAYYVLNYEWPNEISDTTQRFSKRHCVGRFAGYSCDASRRAQHRVNKPSRSTALTYMEDVLMLRGIFFGVKSQINWQNSNVVKFGLVSYGLVPWWQPVKVHDQFSTQTLEQLRSAAKG